MQNLSQTVSVVPIEEEEVEEEPVDVELKRLQDLIEAGEAAEAFFMARSRSLPANLGLRNGCSRHNQCSKHPLES